VSRRRARASALLPALALALACAGLPGHERAASEQEQRDYAAAVAALPKNPREAQRRLEAFLAAYPEGPLSDDAALRLAELAKERRDLDAAARLYRGVAASRGDRADSARLGLARLELSRGNRNEAAAALRALRVERLAEVERPLAYRTLADAAGDQETRVRWLVRLRDATPKRDAAEKISAEIDAALGQMDAEALARTARAIGPDPPAGRALRRAAELELAAGDVAGAAETLDQVSRLPIEPGDAPRLRSLEARVADRERAQRAGAAGVSEELPTLARAAERAELSTEGARGTLGAVLPLSGRFSRFGEQSLQGVLLAAGVFGSDGAGPQVRVLVRDSAGRPDRAAEAVRELAARDDVIGIVGPLLADESSAAAEAAEAAGVPLLALAAREEIGRERPHVFRVRALPREEVELVVDNAMGELGAHRFAILYPRDAYGRGLRRLFWEAVEERGGEITAVASYDPNATDFAGSIRSLLGYDLLSAQEKAVLAQREQLESRARRLPPTQGAKLLEEARAMTGPDGAPLPPILDFDALFIPEAHEKVVLIAPQLAFHDARGIRLLGTGSWNDPGLVAIGRDHVEGARFAASFFAASPVALVQRFAQAYEQAYAGPPAELAAQAYDAANLLLLQLADGRRSREAVAEGLLEVEAQPGVTGVLSLAHGGRKRPRLLGVDRGQIVELE
jgi:ABC-type branched-subunit amino acid transport system substrate-binding protein/predicted negative regulator of RcsB-dependent stress response